MNELELIKSGFEKWYNKSNQSSLSMVINYSDEQSITIKAYHKVNISMVAVGIRNNLSYTIPLFDITEHYNHGVTSEEDARNHMVERLLCEVFSYCSGKGKSN